MTTTRCAGGRRRHRTHDYPGYQDADGWQARYEALPEPVKWAMWAHCPAGAPGAWEVVAWSTVAAEEAIAPLTARLEALQRLPATGSPNQGGPRRGASST